MLVLGIESSCDDTGVALYDSAQGIILSEALHSQTALHSAYGGVVPELASRDHLKKLLPLIQDVLSKAEINISHIDGVAYTAGPGLLGSLLVGASVGRTLAWALDKPSVGVHHMEAHLMAPMLGEHKPAYPFLALLVSGGHTMLVNVIDFGNYQTLGQTLDDAAGEAFDKTAKLLGLPYPGGPALAQLAEQGDETAFKFTRPMTDRDSLDFSFSGLKTQVLTTWQKTDKSEKTRADIAASFQKTIVDTIPWKCKRALKKTGLNQLVIAGGVSANQKLRAALPSLGIDIFMPSLKLCTDNGAMVAFTGALHLARGESESLEINIKARWPF